MLYNSDQFPEGVLTWAELWERFGKKINADKFRIVQNEKLSVRHTASDVCRVFEWEYDSLFVKAKIFDEMQNDTEKIITEQLHNEMSGYLILAQGAPMFNYPELYKFIKAHVIEYRNKRKTKQNLPNK